MSTKNPNKQSWRERLAGRLGWKADQSQGGQQPVGTNHPQQTSTQVEGVKRIGSFVLVPLPANPPDQYADVAARDQYANSLAQTVVGALRHENLLTFDLLEIYTTTSSKGIIRQLFRGAAGAKDLENRIQSTQWSARQQQGGQTGRSSRVYLVPQALEFSSAFDSLLKDKLLVRPLDAGSVPIPKEPTQDYKTVAQILLGEVIIYDGVGTEVGREEIWAWRSVQREDYFTLNVDFDLLHRAFPARLRPFPLGIEIRCSMDLAAKRRIDDVTINIQEARAWLNSVGNKQVNYYIETGQDRHYRDNPLLNLADDILIDATNPPIARSLGQDSTGQPITAYVNRDFEVVAERGAVNFHYLFNFFERGRNFTPQNNSIRVSGQFIRDNTTTTVWIPPTIENQAVELFTLTPQPGGGLLLRALNQPLSITSSTTVTQPGHIVQPGQTHVVHTGDEITLGQSPVGVTVPDQLIFRLASLQGFPAEIINGKNYVAFLEIQGESSSLIAEEYNIGSGEFFPRNTPGIGQKGLIFKRIWTRVSMEAAANQEVWYGKDTPGTNVVERLMNPITLELNDYFRIYLGDFQLRLDLASTPQSE